MLGSIPGELCGPKGVGLLPIICFSLHISSAPRWQKPKSPQNPESCTIYSTVQHRMKVSVKALAPLQHQRSSNPHQC